MRWSVLVLVACSSPAAPRLVSRPPLQVVAPVPLAPKQPTIAELQRSPDPADRVRAVQLAEASCAKGNADDCATFASALYDGIYVDKDEDRANQLYLQACTKKHAQACMQAGFTKKRDDRKLAEELFDEACRLGEPSGCEELADLRFSERDTLRQRAFDMAREACERGDVRSCLAAEYRLKRKYAQGAVPADAWQRAIEQLDRACGKGGDAELCSRYASVLEEGYGGVAVDKSRAFVMRERACELGDVLSCALAAYAYKDGRDIAKDEHKAITLQLRACKLGDGASCYWVGRDEPDPVRAGELIQRSCDLGYSTACYDLHDRYQREATPDVARIRALERRMCGMGLSEWCVKLGQERENSGDTAEARVLYGRACRYGDAWAGCSRELGLLQGAARDARAAELPVARRDLALYQCCRDPSGPPASPTAAVLLLSAAINAKDAKAVAALIHPKRPLEVRVGTHGDLGASADTFKVRANKVDLARLDGVMSFGANGLECGELADDEEAQCRVFEGGFGASYTVAKIGGRYYVVSINEESH